MKNYSVAVCGATGLVGRTVAQLLLERKFPIEHIRFFASSRSAGSKLEWNGSEYTVEELNSNSFDGIDFALFSAGSEASKMLALSAAAAGCVVIDNSSAWRMDAGVPLIVPEVNANALYGHKNIIANPNCSTIQLVVALKPLHDAFGLRRVVVSTYQSISGAGQRGIDQLTAELAGREPHYRISTHRLAHNTVFHNFPPNEDFSEEEIKIKRETRKILDLPNLQIAATCVRLPILGGHGESVNIETEIEASPYDVRRVLNSARGVKVYDDVSAHHYPTTLGAAGSDDVYVGRIRRDDSVCNGLHLWITADNIRKGAATNAVQIAEELICRERNLY